MRSFISAQILNNTRNSRARLEQIEMFVFNSVSPSERQTLEFQPDRGLEAFGDALSYVIGPDYGKCLPFSVFTPESRIG